MNEYNIAVQAFALQGTGTDETQWIEAIKKAQVHFERGSRMPAKSILALLVFG